MALAPPVSDLPTPPGDDPIWKASALLHALRVDATWTSMPETYARVPSGDEERDASLATSIAKAEAAHPPIVLVALTADGLARLEEIVLATGAKCS